MFEKERIIFIKEKTRLEEASKRLSSNSYGQEKLIELEVERRFQEKMLEQERGKVMSKEADDDEKALRAFIAFKDAYIIDYKRINDDDVLMDAMTEADTLDLKKILMRYRRLKNEAVIRDPNFSQRILKNYFSCIRKVGVLVKKQEGSFLGKWDSRFVVLTNAGFMYFKAE